MELLFTGYVRVAPSVEQRVLAVRKCYQRNLDKCEAVVHYLL